MKSIARLLLFFAFMNSRFAIASSGLPAMKSAQNLEQHSEFATVNNEKMTVWIARFSTHKHPLKTLKVKKSENSEPLYVAEVDVDGHKSDLKELKKTAAKEWGISKKIQLLRLGLLVELAYGKYATGKHSYYVHWRDGRLRDPIYYGSECTRLFLAIDEDEEKALNEKIATVVLSKPVKTKQQRKATLKSQYEPSPKPKSRESQAAEYSLAPIRYKSGSQKQLRVQKQAIKAAKKYRNSYVQNLKIKHLLKLDPTVVSKKK
jgi:hypothetical protein